MLNELMFFISTIILMGKVIVLQTVLNPTEKVFRIIYVVNEIY